MFTSDEGFTVLQEEMASNLRPDITVFRLLALPGGSAYEYDFLIGETKVPGNSWGTFEDHLQTVCADNNNDTKNVYGMLQIGFEVQFYKHENFKFELVGGRMHLVDDVQNVIAWAQHMKSHPMRFVRQSLGQ